jgi:hypothetical protein
MDSHKVSVTSQDGESRMIDVTTDRITFSFNWSRVLSNSQIELLATGMWNISGLQSSAELPTIQIYRYTDDSGSGIHLLIGLPPSFTVSLLTQVMDELIKYRATAAHE